jgi:hypothetical protein
MKVKRVGDAVPSFNLPRYIVLLREGGYIDVKNGKISKIVENFGKKHYKLESFPNIPCVDKWGNLVVEDDDLNECGLLGENYEF